MPCSLCDSQDEEIKVCKSCVDYLKSLKCGKCENLISFQNKQLFLLCDKCNEEFKPIYDDKKFIDFYDIILKINSIRDILNGWNIEFSEKGKQSYEKMKTKDFLKVGVAGVGNKGKSFLLQKLANIELPTGTSIKTEGLSIKCPDINSENQKSKSFNKSPKIVIKFSLATHKIIIKNIFKQEHLFIFGDSLSLYINDFSKFDLSIVSSLFFFFYFSIK